jgi:hypothetical protein
MARTSVEVEPIILKAIKLIARHRRLKVKFTANALIRFGIAHERQIFAISNNNRKAMVDETGANQTG